MGPYSHSDQIIGATRTNVVSKFKNTADPDDFRAYRAELRTEYQREGLRVTVQLGSEDSQKPVLSINLGASEAGGLPRIPKCPSVAI